MALASSIGKRCFVTAHMKNLFSKGKLTIKKMADKTLIDNTIETVNVAFPDQYGKL